MLNRLPLAKMVYQGGGNKGISPYIDIMRSRCRDGKVHHGNCPLLRWGIVHTKVMTNSWGQAQFNKKGVRSADDGKAPVFTDVLVSATLAVGALDAQEVVPAETSKAKILTEAREIKAHALRQKVRERDGTPDAVASDGDEPFEVYRRRMHSYKRKHLQQRF